VTPAPPAETPKATVATMAQPAQPPFWNVPNTLTLARLGLAVAVFALIAYARYFAALAVFGLAALSDALDGYLARLLDQATPIGRQLDPLVDKVIVSGTYIYLLTVKEDTGVQPWMVTTIITRELLIQGLRSHLEGQGQAFGARMAGKVKTTFQCLSISAVLLVLSVRPDPHPLLLLGRDALTWAAVGLTVYSGVAYVFAAAPSLKGRVHSSA
jgi:CDP-diacylglycerol--glycerol-3-phosphate 3-phosphatidyltransferase